MLNLRLFEEQNFPIGSVGEGDKDGRENRGSSTSLLWLLLSLSSPQTRFKPKILALRGLPGSESPWKQGSCTRLCAWLYPWELTHD